MTPPECYELLAGCAREFGEIRTQLKEQDRKLDRIDAGIQTLTVWRANQSGELRARQRFVWLIALVLSLVSGGLGGAVLNHLLK